MNHLAIFFGNLTGKIMHAFFGCRKFYKFIKNKNGKIFRRYCARCKAVHDKRNGRWVVLGKYTKRRK